jgi:hypothetical protein
MSAQQKITNRSYYQMMSIQTSADEGAKRHKVDRELAEAVLGAMAGQGDGRIALADLADIAQKVSDGGRYGAGEKALVRALYRATDDRYSVEINGQKVRITDPAEVQFVHQMQSFFGKLGAKAKDRAQLADVGQALNQFAQQLAAQQG